ncbi:MAG TPA: helix-turn-helix domain-containing protein [Candidatus Deferrimicrobium sp.]|nr:helix-turn-helix domain-containing protein [Candidatus Deferrimicrobium sp.]
MRKEKIQVEEESLPDRVIRYVATREDGDFATLSVTSLAEKFEINRFKLLRVFKAEKKMTLDAFLLQEKMCRCSFILMSDMEITVKELAKLMGYCTCNYFIQVFKKYFGIVPGDYKEFKTKRSGIVDRRLGPTDRRINPNAPIPKCGDRRKGQKDRRKGPRDRRKKIKAELMENDLVDTDLFGDHYIKEKEKKEGKNANI